MQGLRITTQRAQIEISSKRAQLIIERPKPRMRIRTRRAQMNVERRAPQFSINREQLRQNRSGQKLQLPIDIGWEGVQHADLTRIGNNAARHGGNATGVEAIADISHERSRRRSHSATQQTPSAMPDTRQQIEWDMGYYDVKWEPHELIVEWDMTGQGPVITFNPHSVEIKLSRYPSVKITYDADYFERQHHKKFDKKI